MSLNDSINENEFLLLQDYVFKCCGISVPADKAYLFETRLTKLMLDVGAQSLKELCDYIDANPESPIRQRIINAITTNETLWFRDANPWRFLEEVCLPHLVGELETGNKMRARIWCSAVATGQEVYSTVMCIDNYLSKNHIKGVDLSCFDFFATDISTNVLDIAKRGRYDKISIMRGLDDYYKNKYFTANGSAWDLDPRIRDAVRFEQFNLLDDYKAFGLFDIIFCRYVLIYFSDDIKKKVLKKMHGALLEGGVLLTGNYVLYDLLQSDFELNHYDNLTYFKKR